MNDAMSLPDKNIRILSVDDFSTMRRIVKNILMKIGYNNVHEAENGVEALKALRDDKFDLVISDWNMPEKSGMDLLRDVRSDPELKDMPFLMVTAEQENHEALSSLEGRNQYLLKPFTAKTLEDTLSGLFSGQAEDN
ncbi:MAG: response regulator [Myxococcota bacterium]